MKITVQDFTGVYDNQPFMQELRQKAADSADIHWLDCTKIVGTDCYCDDDAIKEISELIDNAERKSNSNSVESAPEIHFFDNGNYHYMSKLWTDKVQEPFSLVVFDNHPDMQPPRFGGILSCGGWVLEVLRTNKFIQNVIIIGVKDELVETVREELSQTEDAHILGKVTFVKESENDNLSSFVYQRSGLSSNLYLSIDKDALAPAFAATNWDQGSLNTETLKAIIADLAASHKIIGIDICGERTHDFEGNEQHTVQEADALNNALNRELVEFLQKL
ncbi:MAG: arginase family protein [Fibrobacter sp.]|nr:arginase family protein [Fibrobacter sp.]